MHRGKPSTTGFKGVVAVSTKTKDRFKAQIQYQGKKVHLGVFDTKEEAARAWDKAAIRWRPDTELNFPLEKQNPD